MSWPANPTNGQQVTINGVIYEYDSTPGVWNRVGSGASSVTVDSFTTANLSVTNQAHLGDVNDVIITGGSANYSLTTDGNGNLSWSAIGNAVVPGGANTQVQFNNSGNFEGSANLTFDSSTNTLTATHFSGNGSGLTGIVAGNIVGGIANANYAAYANYSNFSGTTTNANYANYANIANKASTITTAAQPNITSVGTLSNLSVSGNISANNINATVFGPYNGIIGATTPNLATFTNVTMLGNANVTGNVSAGNLNTSGAIIATKLSGTLTTPAQPNITSVGTLSSLNISGLITGHLVPSEDQAFDIGTPNARWRTLYISANTIDLGGTTLSSSNGNIATNGNLTGDNVQIIGQFISTLATGTAPIVVYSNTVVANLNASLLNGLTSTPSNVANTLVSRDTNRNFSANIIQARLFGQANTAGTVVTAAQPNITSVGNLINLGVSGNITGNRANFTGNVSANYYTGNGILLTGIPGNALVGTLSAEVLANTNVYIGTTSIELDRASGALSLQGVNIDGNANIANTATNVSGNAQPNITSLGTLSGLVIAGNLTVTGSTQYANVTTFNVKDPIIEMGGNPNGAPLSGDDGKDRGTLLHYFNNAPVDAFMGYDASNGEFAFGNNVSVTSDVVTFLSYGNVRANYFIGNIVGNSNSAVTAGTVTTAAQPNITSVGTLTSLNVANGSVTNSAPLTFTQTWNNASAVFTGIRENIVDADSAGESLLIDLQLGGTSKFKVNKSGVVTANQYIGNGSQLTSIPAANLVGSVPNANYASFTGAAQTVSNGYQPNITRVGTLTTLAIDAGELTSSNPIQITQRWNNASRLFSVLEANITDDASIVDSKLIDLKVNTISLFTVEKNGNVSAPNFIGNLIGNFSGNVLAPGSNRQIIYNDDGSLGTNSDFTFNEASGTITVKLANITTGPVTLNTPVYFTQTWNNSGVTFTHLRTNITDTFSNINSLLLDLQVNNTTKFKVDKVGGVTGTSYSGSGAGLTNLPAANVTGIIANANYSSYSGNANSAIVANVVSTNAQPNITSVGTLVNLRANTGVISSNTPFTFIQEWSNGTELFTGIRQNITDTASDPTSLLLDLQVDGLSTVTVDKTGFVTATAFSGEGGNLSNIQSSNLIGEVPNANYAIYSTYADNASNANIANTVSANAQPNITSVGNLTGLNIASGSLTTDKPLSIVQTWQNGAVTFNTITASITDTTSNSNSALIDMRVGGNSKFRVTKTGNVTGAYFIGDGSLLSNLPGGSGANFANFAGVVTTNSQPNITSVGNLTSLTVNGVATINGNLNASNNVTANFFVGNANNLSNIPAANIVGSVGSATLASTITTNAQPNITSVGTLSNVVTSGNIFSQQNQLSSSNKIAFISAVDNAGAAAITLGSPSSLTLGQYTLSSKLKAGDQLVISGATGDSTSLNKTYIITNVVTVPSSSVILTVTPDVITRTGGSANVSAVTAIAQRKVLETTSTAITGYFDIANVTTLTVANLTATSVSSSSQPNITSVGNLTSLTVIGNITGANANLGNLVTANFFSGNGSGLSYIAGGNVTGTVANATYAVSASSANTATTAGSANTANSANTALTVINNAQPNITSVGNLTSLTVIGNITSGNANLGNLARANFFSGNGSLLTGVIALSSGTVSNSSQPAITSVGNLVSLTVNSGVTGLTSSAPVSFIQKWNNSSISFKALTIDITKTSALEPSYFIDTAVGGISQFSVTDSGNVKSNNADLGNLATANFVGGTLTTAAQPNITSVGTLSTLSVTGNINAGNAIISGSVYGAVQGVIGGITPYAGTFTTVTATGNVNAANASLGNLVTANYYSGTLVTAAQPNITSVGNLTSLTVIGTLNANVNGTSVVNSSINASTKLTGLSTAIASMSVANANTANTAVTVTASAQPTITSIGNLSALTVDGTLNVGNIVANTMVPNAIIFKQYAETVIAGSSTGSSISPNAGAGTIFNYTATSNFTLNGLTGAGAGTSATIIITQDATGSRIMTSTMKFAGNSKTLSTTAGSIDIISVFYDGTTYYATLSKGYA